METPGSEKGFRGKLTNVDKSSTMGSQRRQVGSRKSWLLVFSVKEKRILEVSCRLSYGGDVSLVLPHTRSHLLFWSHPIILQWETESGSGFRHCYKDRPLRGEGLCLKAQEG